MANKFYIEYYAFWFISPSCSNVLNLSKIALAPAGVISESTCPAYIIKSQAIYTDASLGLLRSIKSNCNPAY